MKYRTPELQSQFFDSLLGKLRTASVVVKSRLTPAALAAPRREQVRSLDSSQPIHNLRMVAEIRVSSVAAARLSLSVLGVFAVVALTLSIVGVDSPATHLARCSLRCRRSLMELRQRRRVSAGSSARRSSHGNIPAAASSSSSSP